MKRTSVSASYFRNFIFGVEDSLVSTVGLLSGIAIANVPREIIFLTGMVLIFVEAFSMAAGSFLSESSAEEYESHSDKPTRKDFVSGIIMFCSYFISGFIPLSSYIIWPVDTALKYSIIFSVLALFVLGALGGKLSKTSVLKNGMRMVVVGGVAIALGVLAGSVLGRF